MNAGETYKQSRADCECRVLLVDEAMLERIDRGKWDADDFARMMDEAPSRLIDRVLLDLD
ncbi:hypothetical protein [Burkholderia territorii]|uniref:hypothetical protein n=1 Tax=Burkholderia territorii TaxID=1503055 RepID=UPI000AFE0D45|nr:hypothetical protein [Burkholderia territorii]